MKILLKKGVGDPGFELRVRAVNLSRDELWHGCLGAFKPITAGCDPWVGCICTKDHRSSSLRFGSRDPARRLHAASMARSGGATTGCASLALRRSHPRSKCADRLYLSHTSFRPAEALYK